MLDEVARERGRSRLAVTAVVSRPGENLLHGMDLKTWVREGLVDTLVPYSSSVRLNSFVPAWDDPKDVAHFVSLVEGSDCELAINLMPRDLSGEEYYRLAHSLYQSGVERFFFWDGLSRARKALRLGAPRRGGGVVPARTAQPLSCSGTPLECGWVGSSGGNARLS